MAKGACPLINSARRVTKRLSGTDNPATNRWFPSFSLDNATLALAVFAVAPAGPDLLTVHPANTKMKQSKAKDSCACIFHHCHRHLSVFVSLVFII